MEEVKWTGKDFRKIFSEAEDNDEIKIVFNGKEYNIKDIDLATDTKYFIYIEEETQTPKEKFKVDFKRYLDLMHKHWDLVMDKPELDLMNGIDSAVTLEHALEVLEKLEEL